MGLRVAPVSWADADRFGPGYWNGWAFGPKRNPVIPGRWPMRSHSVAQSEAAGQVPVFPTTAHIVRIFSTAAFRISKFALRICGFAVLRGFTKLQ